MTVLERLRQDERAEHALRVGQRMIVSRTPLRISFVGGGTDIPEYYRNNGGGAVVNAAINKYVYIIVNKKFDDQVRVSYSQTETVDSADKVRHPLVREALKFLDIRKGVEIVSISDIPSHGTGLGSSSTFTVGLLNALHAWVGEHVSPRQLAEEAVSIERDIVGDPGGRQDQYIAAYGGMRFMEFHPNDRVDVAPIAMDQSTLDVLERYLMLFYTGLGRSGNHIMAAQINEMPNHWEHYTAMRQLAHGLHRNLKTARIDCLGQYLHQNWEYKRMLQETISNSIIDRLYGKAVKAGAKGGKITGAGGGGFLLLFAPPDRQDAIRAALRGLREEPFRIDPQGSRLVFAGE